MPLGTVHRFTNDKLMLLICKNSLNFELITEPKTFCRFKYNSTNDDVFKYVLGNNDMPVCYLFPLVSTMVDLVECLMHFIDFVQNLLTLFIQLQGSSLLLLNTECMECKFMQQFSNFLIKFPLAITFLVLFQAMNQM